ncbi:MAG: dihydrodipicolinate reductase [Aestuariivita sp.]|nr:dihydrodipicolinate reductase [Aestuariivita sp.]
MYRWVITFIVVFFSDSVAAEYKKVTEEAIFVELTESKELVAPFVNLKVLPEGQIIGQGIGWDVTGTWSWQDGYFCRDLNWGGDELGYDCLEVAILNNRIRFTAQKGTGDTATFRLR